MAYLTGVHPHVRSAETLAGRYWTAAALLFPCVLLKIITSWQQIFLLLALFLSAAIIHFICGIRSTPKTSRWKQGILPLFVFLWFLVLPPQVSFWASFLSFSLAFFLGYEFFGGLGAYSIHPIVAGILTLFLFFPKENLALSAGPENFIWNVLGLSFLAFGGLYLGVQKKIRLLPAFCFIASAVFLVFIFTRMDFGFLYVLFIFGFFMVTDSNVSPLKFNAHLLFAAGAGICAAGLLLAGAGVVPACAVSLALWNLASHG